MSSSPLIPEPPDGDVNVAYRLETGATVTLVLAAIAVGLRTVGRIVYLRLGLDDYVMVIAITCAICATVMQYVAAERGLGRHAYYLSPDQLAGQQYFSYIAQAFCALAITFGKISICLTNLRVIKDSRRPMLKVVRCVVWAIMISVTIVNLIVVIMYWATCLPAARSWDRRIPGYCMSYKVSIGFVLMQGAFSALTDYILCVIPVFYIKDLQISKRSKMILCVIMGLGLITGVFATVRTVKTSFVLTGPAYDVSFITVEGLMWSSMERNIAILLGSVPCLRVWARPTKSFTSTMFTRLISKNKDSTTSPHEEKDRNADSEDGKVLQTPSYHRHSKYNIRLGPHNHNIPDVTLLIRYPDQV